MNHLTALVPRRLGRRVMLIALALLTGAWSVPAHGQAAESHHFTIVFRGARIGFEDIVVTRTPSGWLISSSGRANTPVELVTPKFEMTYLPDWQPEHLSIESTIRGQLATLETTFGLTTAMNDLLQGGQKGSVAHQVSPHTIVLPNNYYGAYEALAARLNGLAVGTRLPIYVAPQGEMTATLDRITPHRIVSPSATINLRQFDLTFANPAGPLAVEVWTDDQNRLARLVIPGASLLVVRDDVASVTARDESIRNVGDEDVSIPSAGFNLAATITKPRAASGRLPAVVLVAGAGPQDRDESIFGVPLFGQLAGALADAGFLVVRYDKRGVGQSGGRIERVTLRDYADDVVRIVDWLRKRKDVDDERIAVVGHSEGGAVALVAASQGDHVAALGLLAVPGQTGREITLWQQQHVLDRANTPPADKQAKIAMQTRVLDAVVSGAGWDAVPDDIRRQADTPWFKSWLLFDPATLIAKASQPILILQGSLDTQVPPAQADRLESLARGRTRVAATATRKIVLPGLNHQLVAATTGEADDYPTIAKKVIAPEASAALTAWLTDALAKKK